MEITTVSGDLTLGDVDLIGQAVTFLGQNTNSSYSQIATAFTGS